VEFKEGVKHGRFIVYDKRGKVLIQKTFDTGREVMEGDKDRQQFKP
jgi:antitoxin component YwqK of YwqJK toxin-antitoxin module